jgi:hypothetical protein
VRSNENEEGFGNTGTRSEDSTKKIKPKLQSGSGGTENTEDLTHCDGNRNQLASVEKGNRINQILRASSRKTKVTHSKS